MAEETDQERTHEPSAKRIEEFRKEGRVAMSKDVASAAQLAMAILAFGMLGSTLFRAAMASVRWTIQHAVSDVGPARSDLAHAAGVPTMANTAGHAIGAMGPPALTIALMMATASVCAILLQTRFLIAPEALTFKWERINPISRMGEVFGPKKLAIRTLLAAGKLALTGAVVGVIFMSALPQLTALCLGSLPAALTAVTHNLGKLLAATTAVLGAMAVLDYIWQKRQLDQQMKMTDDEFRRDMEEQEGRPIYKQRRRQMRRDLTMNRIIEEVPAADVVVTNPTHIAIALRYRTETDKAPVVTAKGADTLAMHIRMIARKHGVPIIENRPLARTLWHKVKVGRPIPHNLFPAVAEILARVYRTRTERMGARQP